MRLAFIWQGVSTHHHKWRDGLWRALKHLEESHEVQYFEPEEDDLTYLKEEFKPDWVLYWEAPCTINGNNKDKYLAVCQLPFKKALLFAGGELKSEWVSDFDHVFIESKINADDCELQNIPYSIAFGINEDIFKPEKQSKIFDGIHHGTCASWKRQELLARALGNRGVVCGRNQVSDPLPFEECRKHGTLVLPELPAEAVASLLNASRSLVQTSAFWGGGQRATLEALACGIPVVCMKDSPKNREYVEESGFGIVVEPNPQDIAQAVDQAKLMSGAEGIDYVLRKWTSQDYARSLLRVLQ